MSDRVVQNQTIHEPIAAIERQKDSVKVQRGRDHPVIFLRMHPDEYTKIKAIAERYGITIPDAARRIILDAL